MPRGLSPWADLAEFIAYDSVSTVFDVGANIGETARDLEGTFPHASVLCFEPVASTFRLLEKNTTDLSRTKCFPFGLSDRSGSVDVFIQHNSGWNSIPKNIDRGLGTARADLLTLDDFCLEHRIPHINIIKTDTEGHDLHVLHGSQRMIAAGHVDAVYCEVGFRPDDLGHTYFCAVLEYLQSLSLQFVGLYGAEGIRFIDHPVEPCYPWTNALFVRNALVQARDGGEYERWLTAVLSDRGTGAPE